MVRLKKRRKMSIQIKAWKKTWLIWKYAGHPWGVLKCLIKRLTLTKKKDWQKKRLTKNI